MVSSMPGPTAGSVPARMPSTRARSRASSRAARVPLLPPVTWARVSSRSRASVLQPVGALGDVVEDPDQVGLPQAVRPASWVDRTWTTTAKPSTAQSRAGSSVALAGARRAAPSAAAASWCGCGRRCAGGSAAGSVVAHARNRCRRIAAALEKMRMPEHDDDAGGQLRSDAELVAEVDDQRGDQDVGDERHHEDPVVEDAVEQRAQAAEDRVERGDDGDRQVGLQPGRHRRLEEQPGDDAEHQAERGDHCLLSFSSAGPSARRGRGGVPEADTGRGRQLQPVGVLDGVVDAVVLQRPAGSCRRTLPRRSVRRSPGRRWPRPRTAGSAGGSRPGSRRRPT